MSAENDNNEKPKPRFGKGQPSHYSGKPGRSGPKPGNTNAQRHGMAGGKLGPGLAYIEKRVNGFRRQIESIVMEVKGQISLVDAAAINSACKWERHGMLALNWLRKEGEKLSPSDRLRFSEAIAKASDARDRALRNLKLDDERDNVLEELYRRPLVIENTNDGDADDEST